MGRTLWVSRIGGARRPAEPPRLAEDGSPHRRSDTPVAYRIGKAIGRSGKSAASPNICATGETPVVTVFEAATGASGAGV